MIRFKKWALIDANTIATLDKYPVEKRPSRWDGQTKAVKKFKDEVLKQGLAIQEQKCAWCTLNVGTLGRRTAHRDHIAPKAKYPQWTFFAKNLIIACEYCNGFAVKGEINTVSKVEDVYENCIFHVVHPYLDDPSDHLEFLGDSPLSVTIRSRTPKGLWTIDKLQLDTAGATMERAKDRLLEMYMNDLSPAQKGLLKSASDSLGK
ncbi:hypothetical protein PFAS1_10980 [Pseudomonas frederiksbergensis]|uniref:hypothetical protein n=1 Tax=Pseudomonas frederiksbergensis TaxID=104087 RepID=UPI000958ADD9|nr:hypothetical protein [Pseudomonas frederiksbergensis]APV39844.1 hypothetical protein PFAS1_10980 [Pseudomonas frederiksbergensis]